MKISIIVPTRDRPNDLERCLRSIAALRHDSLEVLVAGQSSDDSTASVVNSMDDSRFRHLSLTTTGKAKGLNAALSEAKGDLIALTDDDCEVPVDWISRGIEAFDNVPDAGIVFGALVAAEHDAEQTYVPVFEPKSFRVISRSTARPHRLGVGANMIVRRSVFDTAGGFDELQGPGSVFRSGDDWEFAYRALRAGYSIVQDPGIRVIHHGTRDYAAGAPRKLISSNYHGIGAGYARHTRAGDWRAAYLLLQEIFLTSADISWNIFRLRRPFGVRRVSYLLLGAIRGLFGTPAITTSPIGRRRAAITGPSQKEASAGK